MKIMIKNRIFSIDGNGNINDLNTPVFCRCVKEKLNVTQIKRNDKELQEKAIIAGCNFIYENGIVYCKNCGRKIEVQKTPEDFEIEEKIKHEKDLENLHLVKAGEDWECGFTYYKLSTIVDRDVWNLIKQYFQYHRKGWSKNEELEWYWDYEPCGWLTQNPQEVENILFNNNHIKKENIKFLKF